MTAEVLAPWANAWDRQAAGDYEANVAWSVETWGGHPDLGFFLDSYHSSYIVEPGDAPAGAQLDALGGSRARRDHRGDPHRLDFNDLERNMELGHEFVRLHLEEMPNIPVMSFNVFSAMSERYWTGYPDGGESVRQPGEQLVELQVHLDPDQAGRRLTLRAVAGGCPAAVPGTPP